MTNSTNIADESLIRIYKFGNCYLNTLERKVFKVGQFIEITPTAFDIMQLLVEKKGDVVTKDEILKKVWGNSFVEEGNLAVHISKLRKALKPENSDSLIETVIGVGYRFVSRVYVVKENEWEQLVSKENLVEHTIGFNSIAVIPLKNENGDEEIDYLADGITESIINSLSPLANIKVIARNTVFKYKDKDIDIQTVGKQLNVATLLTGRIRIIKGNLVIGVELTNVESGNQIWGKQINQQFENIFKVQEEISLLLSNSLIPQSANNVNDIKLKYTDNPESYRLYLKGKYFFDKRSIENYHKAINYFLESIKHDSKNLHSLINLAFCYITLYLQDIISREEAITKISDYLRKIESQNNNFAELYHLKHKFEIYLFWNYKKADEYCNKSLSINPNYLEMLISKSWGYCIQAKFSESLEVISKIKQIAPLPSLTDNLNLCKHFWLAGEYEKAISLLEETLELDSTSNLVWAALGLILAETGRYNEALEKLEIALNKQYSVEIVSMIGYTNALAGRKELAYKAIEELKDKSNDKFVSPIYIGYIYSELGEIKKALECVELSYSQHCGSLNIIKVDPRLKRIRNHPRFKILLSKMGLLDI